MADFLGVLGALAVIALPLALAGWLLRRSERPPPAGRHRVRGKMPGAKEDNRC